ncbi:hypothetical protein pEaSNUABM37_00300 [Erwinia phage pEa_SNUABM_37]|nr:hypothetical protein pEaSNUABM37_00300 [Erwinia phage pEa_SNUABM_37]QXO10768.1 hypothetical protein pEaSNUABM48_00300 [Erwinia phage pEa_SNUABM_48]
MSDYTQEIYRAVTCKTVTKGATMFIDDFCDVWTMIPMLNSFGEMSQFRQYTGRLIVTSRPLLNDATGNYLYLGELVPSYHFSLRNPSPMIAGLQHQLGFYMTGRLNKVLNRYQKKPVRCKG